MVLSKSTKNLLDSTVDLQVDEEIDSNRILKLIEVCGPNVVALPTRTPIFEW